MSTYVYKCSECGTEYEVKERWGSSPSEHLCSHGDEVFHCFRKPQVFTALFKGQGFTRASTNPEGNRKLAPWLGGKKENAPDYQEQREFKHQRNAIQDRARREGGGGDRELSKLGTEMERTAISAMENKYGVGIYDSKTKNEYFSNKERIEKSL